LQVKVYINNATAGNTGIVKIYSEGTSVVPGELIYSSSPVHVNANAWNTIPIPELVTIPALICGSRLKPHPVPQAHIPGQGATLVRMILMVSISTTVAPGVD